MAAGATLAKATKIAGHTYRMMMTSFSLMLVKNVAQDRRCHKQRNPP